MKLAEALTQIKDLKGKVAALTIEIQTENTFQRIDEEDVAPSIEDKFEELSNTLLAMRELKTRIDQANVEGGLADKIHEMEQLRYHIKALEPISKTKQEQKSLLHSYGDSAATRIITVATFDVAKLNERLNTCRARLRELDLELQRLNWEVEV